jgi:hypothetical protein
MSGFSPKIGWSVPEITRKDDFEEFKKEKYWRLSVDMAINMDYDYYLNGFGLKCGIP